LAILQAVAGILAVIVSENPTLATLGWMGVLKSALDVIVRVFLTDSAIKLK
jgi:hypothetical protein